MHSDNEVRTTRTVRHIKQHPYGFVRSLEKRIFYIRSQVVLRNAHNQSASKWYNSKFILAIRQGSKECKTTKLNAPKMGKKGIQRKKKPLSTNCKEVIN